MVNQTNMTAPSFRGPVNLLIDSDFRIRGYAPRTDGLSEDQLHRILGAHCFDVVPWCPVRPGDRTPPSAARRSCVSTRTTYLMRKDYNVDHCYAVTCAPSDFAVSPPVHAPPENRAIMEIRQLLDRVRDLAQTLVPAGTAIRLETTFRTPTPLLVRVNEQEIREALMHLVIHAIESMSGPGRIELLTTREGREVVVTVSDSPTGLSHKALTRMLGHGGDGQEGTLVSMGLRAVSDTLHRHGGRLVIDTRRGGESGAVVSVCLPIHEEN